MDCIAVSTSRAPAANVRARVGTETRVDNLLRCELDRQARLSVSGAIEPDPESNLTES